MCVKCTGRRRASRDAERSDRRLDLARGAGCARGLFHRTMHHIYFTLLPLNILFSAHTPVRPWAGGERTLESRDSSQSRHSGDTHRSLFRTRTRRQRSVLTFYGKVSFVGALPPPPSIQLLTSRRDLSSTLSAHTNTSAWSTRGQGRGAHICHDTCHRITHAGRVVVSRHHTA